MASFPVTTTPAPTVLHDASGTIATANTVQQLLTANPTMIGYRLQNLSLTHSLWINDAGGSAGAFIPGSFGLSPGSGTGTLQAPGGSIESATVTAITAFSGLTGHPFSLVWW